jgi:hypothetical protein
MVRALIRFSTNCCTCPGLASVTFANSSVHSESCSAYNLTASLRSIKLSGVPNSGSPIYFITPTIQFRCFFQFFDRVTGRTLFGSREDFSCNQSRGSLAIKKSMIRHKEIENINAYLCSSLVPIDFNTYVISDTPMNDL